MLLSIISKSKPRLARASSLQEILRAFPNSDARVVEWQTRTFEGRMPKGMRVQVPPRALLYLARVAQRRCCIRLGLNRQLDVDRALLLA